MLPLSPGWPRVGPQITFLPYRGGIPVRYKATVPASGSFGDVMQWFSVSSRYYGRGDGVAHAVLLLLVIMRVFSFVSALTDGVGTACHRAASW